MSESSDSEVSTKPPQEKSASTVSPYTLYASDNPGALISSVVLTGHNYNEWAIELTNALKAKRKLCFVDGSLPQPPPDSADFDSWISVNSMIVGWIRTAIEPTIRSTVTFVADAFALWENLKSRFSVGNKVRVHQLKTQLSSLRQQGQSVMEYYGRLSKVWEELQTYQTIPLCTCGSNFDYAKERDEERVHQFVMGLDDDRFGNVSANIIGTDPLSSLSLVYARIIREEQRLMASRQTEQVQEAVGFVTQRITGPDSSVKGSGQHSRSTQSRDRLHCTHCGRSGHEKGSCWQLHGYPDWFTEREQNRQSSRGRGGRGRRGYDIGGRGQGVSVAHATSSNNSVFPDFTQEQWRTLSQLLQEKSSSSSEKLAGPFHEDDDWRR